MRCRILGHPRRALILGLFVWLAACGGGGGVAPDAATEPPANLSYATPAATYRTDLPISPNLPTVGGGTPASFSVSPDLPAGLALDPTTGVIFGTPLAATPATDCVVVAANSVGQTSTTLSIRVDWIQYKSIAPEPTLDDSDLRHFLTRTHWGITENKLTALTNLGLAAFVDQMLVFPAVGTTAWEQAAEAAHLVHPDDPAGQEGKFVSHCELIRWWIQLMKENPDPFQEVLAFHWHDHFATSSEVLLQSGNRYYMRRHVDMLRSAGVGNVRELLLQIAKDWAMLWWLDGRISTKNAPNENFAREYLELFSVGVDKDYSQFDIVELSRAFTGYVEQIVDAGTDLREMRFLASRHDDTDKVIFGITLPGKTDESEFADVVNLTVDNRPVAEWLVRSLLSGFCYPDPEPALVDQLAQVMRDAGYEIAPVLRTLFLSEAFFSDRARRAVVKSPVDHAVGFMRSTGLRVTDDDLRERLELMDNIPTQPPTVNGWPGGPLWLSAQGMVDRANLLQIAISDNDSLAEQAAHGLDLRTLLPAGSPSSATCVDALAALLGVVLSDAERTRLALYLDTIRNPDGSVSPSPFDANDDDHIQERIRGLLYILGQHPTYMVR